MTKKHLLKIFAVRAAVLFVCWLLLFHLYLIPDGRLNNSLTRSVVIGTQIGLEAIGYNVSREFSYKEGEINNLRGILSIDSEPVVLVADACNGLELFALFAGFLLCFPGRLKYKLFYIPAGIFILFFLNIIREIALALNYYHFRVSFDFNHKYTFAAIVYLVVFLIWRHWMNN